MCGDQVSLRCQACSAAAYNGPWARQVHTIGRRMRQNLIIDVGMHDGGDTQFYLAKGFDVVAIEANPDLADAARERFAEDIANGRLRILSVAIAEKSGTERLAVTDDITIWSSMSADY